MDSVRFGVVGLGAMGALHVKYILQDKNLDFSLAAVCDIDREKAKKIGKEANVPYFTSAQKMFESGLVDAVIIVTPHYSHGPLTVAAARCKLHVLCEKPLSGSVSHAQMMIDECRTQGVTLGVMLHQRTRKIMQTARELVQSGVLGDVFRVQMICSNWFRSQAYYDSGAWRGTWDGEGGGVLINQAPHNLDLFQWVGLGMPKRITAIVETREHKIEVEDTANLLLDYGAGRIGYIYATTAEQPGMEQFILSGNKATMLIQDEKIRVGTLARPLNEYMYSSGPGNVALRPDLKQDCVWKDVPFEADPLNDGKHIEMTRAFALQVLGKGRQYCPPEEALVELEISNAAYLSGYTGKSVDLPVDGVAMDRLLVKLERERSTGRGGGLRKKYYSQMKRLMKA